MKEADSNVLLGGKNRYSNYTYGCYNALMGVISAGFDTPLDIVFTLNTYNLRDLSVKNFSRGHTEEVQ